MFRIILRNPWFAAIWVLATLASAAAFVSEDGGLAMIGEAKDKIREQSRQRASLESASPASDREAAAVVEDAPPAEQGPESQVEETTAPEAAAEAGDTYVVVDKAPPVAEEGL